MTTRLSLSSLPVIGLLISACGAAAPLATNHPPETPPPSIAAPTSSLSASGTVCQGPGQFKPIPVGAACWIDVPTEDDPVVRVHYTISAPGWSVFLGTFKDVEDDGLQRANVLIADIVNLTIDACADHGPMAPPVGPSVDDLAAALVALPPFEVSSPPTEVTAFGYGGSHLQIRVPLDQPYGPEGIFTGCTGSVLKSWIAPELSYAFYGYVAPGDTEDFWILDVDGTRLVIETLTTANASDELLAEQQAVLDSIVIEPLTPSERQ